MTAVRGKEACPPPDAGGQVCAMLAADIADYTNARRDEEIRQHMRTALYSILAEACNRSGIPWNACRHEDQGDGVLVIAPAGIAPGSLVGTLPLLLRILVRRHNRMSSEAARMQLRVSAHIGLVHQDAHGLVSDDITYLFRMLDSRALRQALADSRAEIALAVSGYLYEAVVQRSPSLVDPAQFRHVKSRVKSTQVDAWLHIPGVDQ